jgi:hypothetical protein
VADSSAGKAAGAEVGSGANSGFGYGGACGDGAAVNLTPVDFEADVGALDRAANFQRESGS